MSYTKHFPDFPPSSLPPIPPTWKDTSWHLDSCPSWITPYHHVFVDYEDVNMREHREGPRFSVVDEAGNDVLSTDDWLEVLRVVFAAGN